MKKIYYIAISLLSFFIGSCSEEGPTLSDDTSFDEKGIALDDGTPPAFSQQVVSWNGETAGDASKDAIGTDADIYHELSTFDKVITVEYAGNTALISNAFSNIYTNISGAYVTIDFQTASVSGVEIVLKGYSPDGGLKIYGASKFLLTLDGVNITSRKGPAINNQCKKRMFVRLSEGSENKLTDCQSYTDDPYYKSGSSASNEDRKGCLFSEGNIIFSGTGTLEVKGLFRHGIAADAYMVVRPGVTIAVTEAAKNCIHLKGDEIEGVGLLMKGGYLYGLTTSPAGKCVKTDQNIVIKGGQLVLNTTGDAIYDSVEADTSSAACLKSDGSIDISGGKLDLRSTGKGAKAINASYHLTISDGIVNASCSGGKYVYSETMTASPKTVKADDYITFTGGEVTIISSGNTDGAKGLESDKSIEISKCKLVVYAYDDAINAPDVTIASGSNIYAYSISDDGIRGKRSVNINGGNIMAIGGSAPASGINCDNSTSFTISGGEVVAIGGSINAKPTTTAINCRIWTGLTANKGSVVDIMQDSMSLYSFTLPRTYDGGVLLVANTSIPSSGSLSLCSDSKQVGNASE